MTALYVLVGLLVLLGVAFVVSANRFVSQRHLVQESWRQIDVELRRRHDLVPNLVETVRSYAAHEQRALDAVLRARADAVSTGPEDGHLAHKAQVEGDLTGSLRGLLAVAEGYPDLKAAGPYQQLMAQLAETEDRLAAARRFYNGNVRALNTRIEAFPSSVVAGLKHERKADWFEVDALERLDLQQAPQVRFEAPGRAALEP
jgi:LemA protein